MMTGIQMLNLWHEWLWPIVQFVIGLGVVVFVHELGHFAVAKAVNIRVEQFALGFGARLLGFKKGETEYRINVIPLGGYVKLAGQEDFGPVRESDKNDTGSFANKPVRFRLAVISAGVAMNVLLAGVLFIIVCLSGIRFPAPVVGGVLPGSPAETAEIHWQDADKSTSTGLIPGDRILTVNNRPITRFSQLAVIAELADLNEEFDMGIERRTNERTTEGISRIGTAEIDGIQRFGISPAASMVLADTEDADAQDPLKSGDRILAINGQPVRYNWQIPETERHLDGKPVTVSVNRNGKETDVAIQPRLRMTSNLFYRMDGTRIVGNVAKYQPDKGTVTIRQAESIEKILNLDQVIWPARSEILDILGLVPRLRVMGVNKNSPADRAGIRPGDIIVKYGDRSFPTLGEFRDINDRMAETGAMIAVLREGKRLSLTVHPEMKEKRAAVGIVVGTDLLNPVVADVREGSPAARAGIGRGDRFTVVGGSETGSWIGLYEALKSHVDRETLISFQPDGASARSIHLDVLTPDLFRTEDYQYILFTGTHGFTILMGEEVKKNPLAAVIWGLHETYDFMAMTYATLIGYFRGTVSSKEFAGPIGIGSIAIQAGREGLVYFLYFLAIISVSLAVVNFLPLPVVDGGYVVFLLIEKILGKPVPSKIQNSVVMAGWILMILVFFALTWNDISRIMGNP